MLIVANIPSIILFSASLVRSTKIPHVIESCNRMDVYEGTSRSESVGRNTNTRLHKPYIFTKSCDSFERASDNLNAYLDQNPITIKTVEKSEYFFKINFDEFYKAVLEECKKGLRKKLSEKQKESIKLLCRVTFKSLSKHPKNMLLFIAFALHNTSYLTVNEAEGSEKYKSRGIMQITGLESYKEMTKISSNYSSEEDQCDFVKNPEKVSKISGTVFSYHVRLFENRLSKAKIPHQKRNFKNASKALGVKEYIDHLKSGSKKLPKGTARVKKIFDSLEEELIKM